MTKKEALTRRAEWDRALSEGRVIRYNDGASFTSYRTLAERDLALVVAKAQGITAEVVSMETAR